MTMTYDRPAPGVARSEWQLSSQNATFGIETDADACEVFITCGSKTVTVSLTPEGAYAMGDALIGASFGGRPAQVYWDSVDSDTFSGAAEVDGHFDDEVQISLANNGVSDAVMLPLAGHLRYNSQTRPAVLQIAHTLIAFAYGAE